MARKKSKSLIVPKEKLAKEAIKGIKEEIFGEQVEMVRDYIKGAYRFRNEKEKTIKKLQEEIAEIDKVIGEVEKGNPEAIKQVKVPAKYLSEKTVRLNDMDWDEEN